MSDITEDIDMSESELESFDDSCYEQLKKADKMVRVSEDSYKCAYCPGIQEQIFGFKDLLQHADGVMDEAWAVMCVLLVALGLAEDWKTAEKMIKEKRPCIRMNALHRKALEEWSKDRLSPPKRNAQLRMSD